MSFGNTRYIGYCTVHTPRSRFWLHDRCPVVSEYCDVFRRFAAQSAFIENPHWCCGSEDNRDRSLMGQGQAQSSNYAKLLFAVVSLFCV